MCSKSVPVWFVCKLCRASFQDIHQFLNHKQQTHVKEFENVRCVIFEERNEATLLNENLDPAAKVDNVLPFVPVNLKSIHEFDLDDNKINNFVTHELYALSVTDSFSNSIAEIPGGSTFNNELDEREFDHNESRSFENTPIYSPVTLISNATDVFEEIDFPGGYGYEDEINPTEQMKEASSDDEVVILDDPPHPIPIDFDPDPVPRPSTIAFDFVPVHNDTDPSTTFPFHCTICGKSFNSKQKQEIHIGICKLYQSTVSEKGPAKPKRSKYCGWVLYESERELKKKLAVTHFGDRPFQCTHPNCSRTFKTKSSASQHEVYHVHRPFWCQEPNCFKSFKTKLSLKRHELTHIQEPN